MSRGAARHDFDVTEVTRSLTEAALCRGNARMALRRLKAQGVEQLPSHQTLHAWMTERHVEEYERIREGIQGRVQRIIAAEMENVSLASVELTQEMIERLKREQGELPVRDLPGAIRNLAVSAGVATDKTMLTRERPLQRVIEHRSPEQILKQLEAMGVLEVQETVDGTAEEESPQEIEPGGQEPTLPG